MSFPGAPLSHPVLHWMDICWWMSYSMRYHHHSGGLCLFFMWYRHHSGDIFFCLFTHQGNGDLIDAWSWMIIERGVFDPILIGILIIHELGFDSKILPASTSSNEIFGFERCTYHEITRCVLWEVTPLKIGWFPCENQVCVRGQSITFSVFHVVLAAASSFFPSCLLLIL